MLTYMIMIKLNLFTIVVAISEVVFELVGSQPKALIELNTLVSITLLEYKHITVESQ